MEGSSKRSPSPAGVDARSAAEPRGDHRRITSAALPRHRPGWPPIYRRDQSLRVRPVSPGPGISSTPDPVRPAVARDAGRVTVERATHERPTRRPAHPYRERALALWPGLDRDRLRRCGNDLAKVVRLVAHTTCESADVIEAMLSARPETQVVMPPIRRITPIPIDPYVVLPRSTEAVEADDEEQPVTAPQPRRIVTSHDIPWIAAAPFGGRDGERAGSA